MMTTPDPRHRVLDPLDVACLVARLRQIDREQRPEHWLWADRVIGCDVARLMRVPEVAGMVLDAEGDDGDA